MNKHLLTDNSQEAGPNKKRVGPIIKQLLKYQIFKIIIILYIEF